MMNNNPFGSFGFGMNPYGMYPGNMFNPNQNPYSNWQQPTSPKKKKSIVLYFII